MAEQKKKRRWLRVALVLLLVLLLLPVVLVGGAFLFISTDTGGELVRSKVLGLLNDTFAGRLDASKVEIDGNHLVLRGVKLYSPEGELVAEIPLIETDVDFAALADKTVDLRNLSIHEPVVHLKNDERGLNVARVFASKTPSPPSTEPNTWAVKVTKLDLNDGALDFEAGETRVDTKALNLRGDVKLALENLDVNGALALDSHVTGPLEEELVAKIDAKGQSHHVDLSLGETKLAAMLDVKQQLANLENLTVGPNEVKAFVEKYPVKVPVNATGKIGTHESDLHVTAGKAAIEVTGRFELEKNTAEAFHVKATNVDLNELIGAELPSQLNFDASGALTDTRPASLTGKVTATADWSDGRNPLAALSLDATANNGAFNVSKALITSPGAELTLHGSATTETLDLEGTLLARDLKKVDQTLKRFAQVDVGGLSGTGQLSLKVKGPVKSPAVKAVGSFKQLRVATVSIGTLEVDADVPDVTTPQQTDIMLRAKNVQSGERHLDEVTLDFYTYKGRGFDLDLSTKGLGDLKLNLTGTLDKDNTGAHLNTAALTWTGSNWVLEAPTHASWSNGLALDPFALHDGTQRIEGHVLWAPRKVDVAAKTTQVDLAKLPHVLVPPSLGLAGLFDLNATVTGTPKKPDAKFTGRLTNGVVEGVDGIALDLDGTWKDERAAGTLKVGSPVGALNGTFDVPVIALLAEKPEPISAHLTLDNVPLSQVAQKLNRELPVSGQLSAVVDVSGTAKALKAVATVASPELQSTPGERRITLRNPKVRVETQDDGALMATVTTSAFGGEHRLTLTTPLTISGLRKKPPTKESLLTTPVTLDLSLENFSPLARHAKARNGSMTVTGSLTGPVRAPLGELKLSMTDLSLPPLKKLNGTASLTLQEKRIALLADVAIEKAQALTLDFSLEAPASKFITPILDEENGVDAALAALEKVPLKLAAKIPQIDATKALEPDDEMEPPTGVLRGVVNANGTVEALRLNLDATISGAGFDKVKLENARIKLDANSREQHLNVVMGANRHDFIATAHAGLDLRPSSLRAGVNWKDAPVTATLEAHDFDLAFLTGVTEAVRAIEGQLNLKGSVSGTLGAPKYVGDASLQEGRVALAGNGDYRHIAMKVHATNDLIELQTLSAKAGAGKAELKARAERQPSGVFALTSSGFTDKFPIVNDDQLMAIATLKYSLEGDVSSTLVDIRSLKLPDVVVELPEVKRKDLQDLQRPKDIVVVRASDRRKKKKTAPTAAESEKPGFAARIIIEAPRNVWVKSSDVNIELGLSDGFTVEYQKDLRIRGEARIKRGTLNVIGREFTINSGSEVRFAGPVTQPYINVSAIHVNQREEVKITVSVAGKGTDIGLKVTSDPPMPESDIYAILATGRRTLRQGGGNTITPGQAASVVGQLAASQLKTVIAKKLPLDVLNFETGDEFKNVKLDIGWYLNDVLYLGGTMNIGANRDRGENVWGGRLEFQMTRTLSLEAYAGDAPSYGGDVMFSREF